MEHPALEALIDSATTHEMARVGLVAWRDDGKLALLSNLDDASPDGACVPTAAVERGGRVSSALVRLMRDVLGVGARAAVPLRREWRVEHAGEIFFAVDSFPSAASGDLAPAARGVVWCDRAEAARRILASTHAPTRVRDLELLAIAQVQGASAERRLLDAVRTLHRRGFERLRVRWLEGPDGARGAELSSPDGATLPHSPSFGQSFFGWSDAAFDAPFELADRILFRASHLVLSSWGADPSNVSELSSLIASLDAPKYDDPNLTVDLSAVGRAAVSKVASRSPYTQTLQPSGHLESAFRETLKAARRTAATAHREPVPAIIEPTPSTPAPPVAPAPVEAIETPPPAALRSLHFAAPLGDLSGVIADVAMGSSRPSHAELIESMRVAAPVEVAPLEGFDPFTADAPEVAPEPTHDASGDLTSAAPPALRRARGALLAMVIGDALATRSMASTLDGPALIDGPTRSLDPSPSHASPSEHRVLAAVAARAAALASEDPHGAIDRAHHGLDAAARAPLLARVVPLALHFAGAPQALLDAALAESSRAHDETTNAVAGVAFASALAHMVSKGGPASSALDAAWLGANEAARALISRGVDRRQTHGARIATLEALRRAKALGRRGFCATGSAFEDAFARLAHVGETSAALLDAANRGGDRRLRAIATGALVGALAGDAAIPSQWVEAVLSDRAPTSEHARALLGFAERTLA